MKKFAILIISTLLLSSCATSVKITNNNTQIGNFTNDNGVMYWSYIYNVPTTDIELVKTWFSENFNINKSQDNSMSGTTHENTIPFKQVGYSAMKVILLYQHPCVIHFDVDFKEDRYRVIVNEIIWKPQMYGTRMTANLQELVFKKDGYNSAFVNNGAKQLDDSLIHIFTYKVSKSKDNDNW